MLMKEDCSFYGCVDNVLHHLTHSFPWSIASAVFSAFLQASGERNSWIHLHVQVGWDLQTETFGRWHHLTWVSMIGRSKHNAGSGSSKVYGKLADLWSSLCHSLCGAFLDIPSLGIPEQLFHSSYYSGHIRAQKGVRRQKWRWPEVLTDSQWRKDLRWEVTQGKLLKWQSVGWCSALFKNWARIIAMKTAGYWVISKLWLLFLCLHGNWAKLKTWPWLGMLSTLKLVLLLFGNFSWCILPVVEISLYSTGNFLKYYCSLFYMFCCCFLFQLTQTSVPICSRLYMLV